MTVGMLCLGLSLCPPGSMSWAVPTQAQSAKERPPQPRGSTTPDFHWDGVLSCRKMWWAEMGWHCPDGQPAGMSVPHGSVCAPWVSHAMCLTNSVAPFTAYHSTAHRPLTTPTQRTPAGKITYASFFSLSHSLTLSFPPSPALQTKHNLSVFVLFVFLYFSLLSHDRCPEELHSEVGHQDNGVANVEVC